MPEEDIGAVIGKQWREGQNTRSQLGTGDTTVWVENYQQTFRMDTVNIVGVKTWSGSEFTVGVHLLGSWHPYQTADRLDIGSYFAGAESNVAGSLILHAGSSVGSWTSPTLHYSLTENYDADGNITDIGSNTWRYLTYDYSGDLDKIELLGNIGTGSFPTPFGSWGGDSFLLLHTISPPTGSDDLEYIEALSRGLDIRLRFMLSTGGWSGSIFLAYKPAVLGSELIHANVNLSESRVLQDITENFDSTTYRDVGETTGDWGSGSLTLGSGEQAQSLSYSDDWDLSNFDRFTITATGSNLAGSINFYLSSDNDSSNFVQGDRGIEKQIISTIGSKVKWRAVYTKTSGSAIINDLGLIYKSTDY